MFNRMKIEIYFQEDIFSQNNKTYSRKVFVFRKVSFTLPSNGIKCNR